MLLNLSEKLMPLSAELISEDAVKDPSPCSRLYLSAPGRKLWEGDLKALDGVGGSIRH